MRGGFLFYEKGITTYTVINRRSPEKNGNYDVIVYIVCITADVLICLESAL